MTLVKACLGHEESLSKGEMGLHRGKEDMIIKFPNVAIATVT